MYFVKNHRLEIYILVDSVLSLCITRTHCINERKRFDIFERNLWTVIFIIMAEDEDGVSNKKSAQNLNNEGSSQENEQNRSDLPYFPRLVTSETEETKYNNSENGDASPADAKSSSSSKSLEVVFCYLNIKAFLESRSFFFRTDRGYTERGQPVFI